jgi:DNA repair protein RecO (recombination protein O)
LNELLSGQDIEGALRTFERHLLSEIGYALELSDLDAQAVYFLRPEGGLQSVTVPRDSERPRCFGGKQLLAIGEDDYSEPHTRRAAKRLMRLALDQMLGGKALRSRELFQRPAVPAGMVAGHS